MIPAERKAWAAKRVLKATYACQSFPGNLDQEGPTFEQLQKILFAESIAEGEKLGELLLWMKEVGWIENYPARIEVSPVGVVVLQALREEDD